MMDTIAPRGAFPRTGALLLVLLLVPACSGGGGTHGEETTGHHADANPHADEASRNEGHEEGILELAPSLLENLAVTVATVVAQELPASLATTGRVDYHLDRLAHLSPRVEGRVHALRAHLGDRVARGDALIVLDSVELGDAQAAYLELRAELALARESLARMRELLAEGIASEQELLEAKTREAAIAARAQAARSRLALLGLSPDRIARLEEDGTVDSLVELRSPLDGTVIEKEVTLGGIVEPDHRAFTVADLRELWVWIDIYERDLPGVHRGDRALVEVEAAPGEPVEGELDYIRDEIDPETRTARARVVVGNPQGVLKPGMFARVVLLDPHGEDGAPARPVPVVPEAAIVSLHGEDIAFIPRGEGRFELREVELGRSAGGFVELLAGLSPGEKVVVEGAFLLKSEASKEALGGGHGH